jgi:hypothetical protein
VTPLEYTYSAHLRETLLLQISYDALAQQTRSANEIQDFVIVVADERKLKSILCGVNGDSTRTSGTVQTVHNLALDASQVDWVVKGANDPMVAIVMRVNNKSLQK